MSYETGLTLACLLITGLDFWFVRRACRELALREEELCEGWEAIWKRTDIVEYRELDVSNRELAVLTREAELKVFTK